MAVIILSTLMEHETRDANVDANQNKQLEAARVSECACVVRISSAENGDDDEPCAVVVAN